MPWIIQMVWFAVLLVGLAFVMWIGIWVLLAAFTIGVIAVIWSHLRDFLLAKGILNPRPGVPHEGTMTEKSTAAITVIEGEYEQVDDHNIER